jgi:hypothetical protein
MRRLPEDRQAFFIEFKVRDLPAGEAWRKSYALAATFCA